jgi:hypothetical protein
LLKISSSPLFSIRVPMNPTKLINIQNNEVNIV